MQSRQQQLQAKNIKSLDIASVQEQGQVSENESQFELTSRTVRRIFGANGSLFIKKNKAKSHNCHWTLKENILYKEFLKQKINLFESNFFDRKICKINVMMSDQIKIKTSDQCRSHHQKMMKRHKTAAGIIKFIEDIQNGHSKFKIKQRTKQGGLRRLTKDSFVQQINERLDYDSSDMIPTLTSAELLSQIESLTKQDICLKQIEVNDFNCSHQLFSEYFQPNVWWDGSEI